MTAEGRANKRQLGSHRQPLQKTSKNHAGEIFSDSEWGLRSGGGGNEHVSAIAPHLEGRAGVALTKDFHPRNLFP